MTKLPDNYKREDLKEETYNKIKQHLKDTNSKQTVDEFCDHLFNMVFDEDFVNLAKEEINKE